MADNAPPNRNFNRFMGSLLPASELAVGVLPIRPRRDGLDRVPVLGDLAALDPEEVIERARLACELALAGDEHEVALAQDFVDTVVLHGYDRLGHGLPRGAEAGQAVGDLRVVLLVAVSVAVIGTLSGLGLGLFF